VVQSFRLKIIGRLINEKPLILLTLIYFLFRLSNLTRLPIFNDESIYLHWSQIITKTHHYFYPALFDGKQPLPIWLFSLAGFFSSNLFLAGRLTVVLIGLGTTIGVFLTARRIFDRKIAFWLSSNIQSTFIHGTPIDVENEIKYYIKEIGNNEGGLAIYEYTDYDAIQVPKKNVRAQRKAVAKWGNYNENGVIDWLA